MSDPEAKSEAKINSYETAITTLGKLGLFQNQSDMLLNLVDNLPLAHSDAAETHLLILKEVFIKTIFI
jgi:hypothetical protein